MVSDQAVMLVLDRVDIAKRRRPAPSGVARPFNDLLDDAAPAVTYAGVAEDARQVTTDRLIADEELASNLLTGVPVLDESHNRVLSRG